MYSKNAPAYQGQYGGAAPAAVNSRQADNLVTLIEKQRNEIRKALGSAIPVDRFVRVCMTAVRQTPRLEQSDPKSFLLALMACAQLGLEPNTPQGLAYMIPYQNHGRTETQIQIGYKGLLQLMWRSGTVASINADVVYRQELEEGLFRYESGMELKIEHTIDLLNDVRTGRDEDIVAAYACAKLKTGQSVARVLTRRDIDAARASSQSAKSSYSPWSTHYKAMAIKTAIKRLADWIPQTQCSDAIAIEDGYAQTVDGVTVTAPLDVSTPEGRLKALNSALDAVQPAGRVEEPPHEVKKRGRPRKAAAPAPAPEPEPASVPEPEPMPEPVQDGAPAVGYGIYTDPGTGEVTEVATDIPDASDEQLPPEGAFTQEEFEAAQADFRAACMAEKLSIADMVGCYCQKMKGATQTEAIYAMGTNRKYFARAAELVRQAPGEWAIQEDF